MCGPLSLVIVSFAFISDDIILPLPLTFNNAAAVDNGIDVAVLKFVSSRSRCSFANSGQSWTIVWMPWRV